MTTSLRVIFVLALLHFTAIDAGRVRFPDFHNRAQSWTTTVTGRHRNHVILKRISPDEQCTPDSDELDGRIAALRCDTDFYRAIRETGCALPRLLFADNDFRDCGSDSNGTFCAQHDTADTDPSDLARDINDECFEPPSQNCSSSCRETLEEFSERFGCCVHSDRVISDRYIRVLTPQLWQDCGVERPEPCDNSPASPPVVDANITCTVSCSYTQYNAIYCKHLARKAIDIYNECGDDENAMQVAQECGFSGRGMFCAGLGQIGFLAVLGDPNDDELSNEFVLQVYNKCLQFFANGTCPSECRDSLQEIRNKYGCCFNNINKTAFDFALFNDEDDPQGLVTGYDLWSACGVETPGLCSLPDDVSVYDDLMHCSVCPVELEVISTGDKSDESNDHTKAIVGGVLGAIIFLVALSIPILIFCYFFKKSKSSSKAVLPTHPAITQRNGLRISNGRSTTALVSATSDDVIGSPVAHTYDYIPYPMVDSGSAGNDNEGIYELDMPEPTEPSSKSNGRDSYAPPEPLTSPNAAYNVFEYAQQQKSSSAKPQDYLKPVSHDPRAGAAGDDGEYIAMFYDQDHELYG